MCFNSKSRYLIIIIILFISTLLLPFSDEIFVVKSQTKSVSFSVLFRWCVSHGDWVQRISYQPPKGAGPSRNHVTLKQEVNCRLRSFCHFFKYISLIFHRLGWQVRAPYSPDMFQTADAGSQRVHKLYIVSQFQAFIYFKATSSTFTGGQLIPRMHLWILDTL